MNKNYEIELELRDNLNECESTEILDYMKTWSEKFGVNSEDGRIYFKKNPVDQGDEFGSVSFFYALLLDKKEFFKTLKYSDYVHGEFDVAVEGK